VPNSVVCGSDVVCFFLPLFLLDAVALLDIMGRAAPCTFAKRRNKALKE
jgi:hypothetical protein